MLCGICYGMVLSRTDGWLNARMIKRDETYLMTVSIVINCRTDRCIVRNTFCINEYRRINREDDLIRERQSRNLR